MKHRYSIAIAIIFVFQLFADAQQKESSSSTEMVLIPAGEFLMGNTDAQIKYGVRICKKYNKHCSSWFPNEGPQHKVYLDAYYIDKYEVTIGQYLECVEAKTCPKSYPELLYDTCYTKKYINDKNNPVNCVTWFLADEYCKWSGKRLPTEAEWEKAARGTDGRTYPWGEEEADCEHAVISDKKMPGSICVHSGTWPVGSKPKDRSPYGVMDMAGNVEEWVADWYDDNYYKNSPYKNPKGPETGEEKVIRGGSFMQTAVNGRIAGRGHYNPFEGYNFIWMGFRCAKDAD